MKIIDQVLVFYLLHPEVDQLHGRKIALLGIKVLTGFRNAAALRNELLFICPKSVHELHSLAQLLLVILEIVFYSSQQSYH